MTYTGGLDLCLDWILFLACKVVKLYQPIFQRSEYWARLFSLLSNQPVFISQKQGRVIIKEPLPQLTQPIFKILQLVTEHSCELPGNQKVVDSVILIFYLTKPRTISVF